MSEEIRREETVNTERPASKSWLLLIGGSLLGLLLVVAIVLAIGGRVAERTVPAGMMRGPGGFERGYGMRGGGHMFRDSQSSQGTGVVGGVVSVSGNTVTVRSNGANQSVAIANTTSFYKQGAIAKQSDLQVGDIVTIIGAPNTEGVIQATEVDIR